MKQTGETVHTGHIPWANEWRVPNAAGYLKKITLETGMMIFNLILPFINLQLLILLVTIQRDDEQNISHQGHARSLACR